MEKIFSKEKVNTGRQRELDVAKALAILFMVLVHVDEEFLLESHTNGLFNRIVEFLGSPTAAPVFMFCLGAGIVYSRKNDAKSLFHRGIMMMVYAYVLNLFRYLIPLQILAWRTGDASYAVEGVELFFDTDIFPLASVTFLFFALIKKLKLSDAWIPALWSVFALLNLMLTGVGFESHALNAFFGLFWGTYMYAWFPFFTWIFYPILGYFFAKVLMHCQDKKTFYRNTVLVSAPLTVLLWTFSYLSDIGFGAYGELYQEAYYQHNIIGNLALGAFVLFWISICFYVTQWLPEKTAQIFGRWCKNTSRIYCVHWVIIGICMIFIEFESLKPISIVLLSVLIFELSDAITLYYGKWEMLRRNQKEKIKSASCTE